MLKHSETQEEKQSTQHSLALSRLYSVTNTWTEQGRESRDKAVWRTESGVELTRTLLIGW